MANKKRETLALMFRNASQSLQDCKGKLRVSEDARLRALADFANFQAAASKQRQELVKYAASPVVADLAPVLTSIDRSKAAMKEHDDLLQGQEALERQLKSVFKKHGAATIKPAELTAFDPATHDAISTIPAPSPELEGSIAATIETGVAVHDRIVVPARVVVFGPGVAEESPEEQQSLDGLRQNPAPRRRRKKASGGNGATTLLLSFLGLVVVAGVTARS
jgi:molecular chaperone GrpE